MTHLDYVRDKCFGIKLKRERERERVGEKKSENESCCAGMFLNEGEKEIKEGGWG